MNDDLLERIWKYKTCYFYLKKTGEGFHQWIAINEKRHTSEWETESWIEDLKSGDYEDTGWKLEDLEAFKLFIAL